MHPNYPGPEEVDAWAEAIWQEAQHKPCAAEWLEDNGFTHSLGVQYAAFEFRYIRFAPPEGVPFYGYWQPAWSQPAPLLVHVPGGGAELGIHPDLVMQGYHVLHISPLGYCTPEGLNPALPDDIGKWPVFSESVTMKGKGGYRTWLLNCVQAIRWVQRQPGVLPGRISFFGTSQGGGGALLLGSIFRDHGTRCVGADMPFLTNIPLGWGWGGYNFFKHGMEQLENKEEGWRALGFIDTLSHAHRMTYPVLLTAGGDDELTPPDTIESLFPKLPCTRSFVWLHRTGHRASREFMHLMTGWFRMYA